MKESKIPINCKNFIHVSPRVNAELWSFLQKHVMSLDLVMQNIKQILGLGIVPVIRLTEQLSKMEFDVTELREFTSNALTVLSSAFF